MVALHYFDLLFVTNRTEGSWPPFAYFVKQQGGILFIILSGICVYFSKNCVKRGIFCFGLGMLLSLATYLLFSNGFETKRILIQFGVLHLIGISMILAKPFMALGKKFPGFLAIFSIVAMAIGFYLRARVEIDSPYLFFLGVPYSGWASFDWRPIFPNIGFFTLGMWLSPRLYEKKESIFGLDAGGMPVIRQLCWIGRNSLAIYLLHFPVLYLILN